MNLHAIEILEGDKNGKGENEAEAISEKIISKMQSWLKKKSTCRFNSPKKSQAGEIQRKLYLGTL